MRTTLTSPLKRNPRKNSTAALARRVAKLERELKTLRLTQPVIVPVPYPAPAEPQPMPWEVHWGPTCAPTSICASRN
jgi:hypothetical protein